MSVPKATCFIPGFERNIGLPGHSIDIQTISATKSPDNFADSEFRACVLADNAPHNFASFLNS